MREEENSSSKSEDQIPRDVQKLFSRLNLGHSQYQRFEHSRVKAPIETVVPTESVGPEASKPIASEAPSSFVVQPMGSREAERKPLLIGVYSPIGGAGKTMLAASVGALLSRMGKYVLMVDTSEWQTLSTHFGAQQAKPGIRTFRSSDGGGVGIHVLSCGSPEFPPDLNVLTTTMPIDCVIFDLGGLPEEQALAWLKRCDRMIVPLSPTTQAPIMAYAVREKLGGSGLDPAKLTFVLNLMDQSPTSHRVRMLLEELLQNQLFVDVINLQEAVDEALGEGIALPFYASDSQAARVCREIVNWLQLPESTKKRASRWLEE